ncbi:Receptor-like serine/threonine-protein kinase ALE2 [Ananas comosus]|uniref:Receptor-like serine/threonine-protein kinase ALE2 n=2 Tax=Ananas comosus TaxID=4615 RepID=A0A199W2M4_ANACO|nr:Receptor-like serine/threonine-protein kinase ALE2 [Ananas comosus]
MLRRCGYRFFVVVVAIVVLLVVAAALSEASGGNATCPYDIAEASGMIPAACYANATNAAASAATSCCWFVVGSYIFAAARYANLSGAAFLPAADSSACSSAFSSFLLGSGLASPSLFNGSCDLSSSSSSTGGGGDLAAGARPCQYASVSELRAAAPAALDNATALCAGPSASPDLVADQAGCAACQTAVIGLTFALLGAAGPSAEPVPCGMAATIGVWSRSRPSLPRFRSYALCMVQVLENVNTLGGGDFVPSPPPPPTPPHTASSRSVKIAAGSAAAALASVAAIVLLSISIYSAHRRRSSVADDQAPAAGAAPVLPTDGLYIFTEAELQQATEGYDDRLLLGEGGAGKVYLGRLPSGQHVAIKRIYRDRKIAEFYREVEILAKLRHRNLTTLLGYCAAGRGRHVALVYEYMAGGNLSRALFGGELAWRRRLRIAADVAEGLVYLHEFPEGAVVHRDVKPTNVLLSAAAADAAAKLSDFGVSRMVPHEGTHVSTEVRGTMGYVDPESFCVGHVSEAADVYSFGVVLLELVTGMRAVVPTPSGGAESIVHAAHAAVQHFRAGSDGADDAEEGAVGSIVDPRLGAGWDRASVAAVFRLACRCVRPYKNERPRMAEVLAALKATLADLEARSEGRAAAAAASEPSVTDESSSSSSSAPSASRTSTASAHGWSS